VPGPEGLRKKGQEMKDLGLQDFEETEDKGSTQMMGRDKK